MNKSTFLSVIKTLIFLTAITHSSITLSAQHVKSVITDIHGQHNFTSIPKRVISLSWSLTENLLELGITPLAIPDTKGYKKWVRLPKLPESVTDLGLRQEPNLEKILALKPDIILLEEEQESLTTALKKIAPVLSFQSFRADHNNYKASEKTFLQLGSLFNKNTLAKNKLDNLKQELAKNRSKIKQHFNNNPPPIISIRFNNTSVLWVYGKNSMPQHTLNQLGLKPALETSPNKWGVTQKTVMSLSHLKNSIVLYFSPTDGANQLFTSPLWLAMPFVQKHYLGALPALWSYGGPMSIHYMNQEITQALLKMPSQ